MYEIKKGVPIPNGKGKGFSKLLRAMEIGDCIEVDWENYYCAHAYARKCKIKVTCRAQDGIYRIWRTA